MSSLEIIPLQEEELYCPVCGTRLLSKGWRVRKHRFLNDQSNISETSVRYQRAVCPNRQCKNYHKTVVPRQLRSIFFCKSPYDINTTQTVVALRKEKHLTYEEIRERTGIPIATAHDIDHRGTNFYVAIVSVLAEDATDSTISVIESPDATIAVREIKGVTGTIETAATGSIGRTVMLDATSEKMSRHKSLVVIDAPSNRVLLTAILRNGTAEAYETVFATFNKYYFVENLVSDMEAGLKKAIRECMPTVRHQYCHFHFLKNAGTKLLEEDYEKLQKLTSVVLRDIKKDITSLMNACEYVNSEVCPIFEKMRLILDARPRSMHNENVSWGDRTFPFYLVDLRRAQVLVELIQFVLESDLACMEGASELKLSILHMARKVQHLRMLIDVVEQKYNDFTDVRKMLERGGPDVREKIQEFLRNKPHLSVLRDYFSKYDEYLWHYVDEVEIPRTIVKLERLFGKAKRMIRGVNPIPGVTLDRLGLYLPFITEASSVERRWSKIAYEKQEVISRYHELWGTWMAMKKRRKMQLKYDVLVSSDAGMAEVLQELASEVERVARRV